MRGKRGMRGKKRGFSIAEAVVAMAVVVVVSISSISAVLFATTANRNAMNQTRGQSFAQNMLECFKAADNLKEFEACARFAEGIGDESQFSAHDDNGVYVYSYTPADNAFKSNIRVSFSGDGDSRPIIQIKVITASGETIVEFKYKKGG